MRRVTWSAAALVVLVLGGIGAAGLMSGPPLEPGAAAEAARVADRTEDLPAPRSDLISWRVLGGDELGADPSGHISPDGTLLSYPDWESGELAVRNLQTGETRRLTDDAGDEEGYRTAYLSTFSPDGTKIAYQWTDLSSYWALRVVDVRTGGVREVMPALEVVRYTEPRSWSPDGKEIAVVLGMTDGSHRIVLVDEEAATHTVLRSFDWRYPAGVAVSPDGEWLAYALAKDEEEAEETSDIFLLARDGSREVRLLQGQPSERLTVAGWLPDGGPFLYLSESGGISRLMGVEVEGGRTVGEPRELHADLWQVAPFGLAEDAFYYVKRTEVPRAHTAGLDPESGELTGPLVPLTPSPSPEWTMSMAWSPDGDRVAYWSAPMWGPQTAERLVVRSLVTGMERRVEVPLSRALNLEWSPVDDRLAVWGTDDRVRSGIHLVDLAEERLTRVPVEANALLGWSSDGSRIHATRTLGGDRTGDSVEGYEVLAVDPVTGQDEAIFRSPGTLRRPGLSPRAFAVSPDERMLAVSGPDGDGFRIDLVPLEGGEARKILRIDPPEAMLSRGELAWTPDGEHLLFGVRLEEEGQVALRLASRSGSKVQDLASFPSNNVWVYPKVHPNGREIAASFGLNRFEIWALEGLASPVADEHPSTQER